MSILLTGGAGFIGSHTAVSLLNAGQDIVIVDNLYNSSPKVIDRIERITGKRPVFVEADCCDRAAMDRLFSDYDITGVIHFAGLKAVGESVEKPLLYYRNNLDSTLTVLEVMREHNCHQFVFSSSATVYGDQPAPLYETAQTGGCSNPYGWTKFMIEEILKGACRADPALSVVLLRYFNPIGAHESGLIGENPNGIPNNLMPYITQVAIGRRERLTVFGDDYDTPDGTGVTIISTSSIWPRAICARSAMRRRTPAARSSTSAPAAASACWKWCTPSPRSTMFPSPTSSARAAQAIWPRSTQTQPRQSRSLAGRQRKRLPICAATAGAGRPGTRPDIKPGAFEKHIEPCTGTPVFRFRQKTVAFLKKRCYDISASNRQGSYIGSTAASQAAEAGSTPVPCSI